MRRKRQQELAGIQRAVNPDYLEVEGDMALVAVVGRSHEVQPRTAWKNFLSTATLPL